VIGSQCSDMGSSHPKQSLWSDISSEFFKWKISLVFRKEHRCVGIYLDLFHLFFLTISTSSWRQILSNGEFILAREFRSILRKPIQVPLFPLQIPHGWPRSNTGISGKRLPTYEPSYDTVCWKEVQFHVSNI
jgi:hypothetical protein